MFPALFVLQVWLAFATGQLDETAFGADYTAEDRLQKESEEDIFKDYIPIQTSREQHFLEGLIVEAGMHVLFPQLYVTKDENLQSMTLEEKRGQPEFLEDYTKSKRKSDCPDDCPLYNPVCGSDGKVYPSECHLRKENCGSQNVTSSGWEICRGKHYLCPFRCLDLSDPVCATDGKIYHNICIMRKLNCGKLLQVLPLRKCYEDFLQSKDESSCPNTCPEISKPVCGSNGIIYFNECFLRMRTCSEGVVAVEMENCVQVPKCPEVCLPFYDPVCGSDGHLYINRCRMLQHNCGKGIRSMPRRFCSSDVSEGNKSRT